MIDLHTHSLWSDGGLLLYELIRRAEVAGYKAIAITDHVDLSNLSLVIPRVVEGCRRLVGQTGIIAIPGAELTYIPPALIAEAAAQARELGAEILICHGETLVEPTPPGTNHAAIEAGVDIVAHPGLIAEADVILAKERGVALELSTRGGHSLSNGHVARLATKHGARLLINNDAHVPSDLQSPAQSVRIALGAGLTQEQIDAAHAYAWQLVKRAAAYVPK